MGKRKIGEIYNKPIIEGDINLKTPNEIHKSELSGGGNNSELETILDEQYNYYCLFKLIDLTDEIIDDEKYSSVPYSDFLIEKRNTIENYVEICNLIIDEISATNQDGQYLLDTIYCAGNEYIEIRTSMYSSYIDTNIRIKNNNKAYIGTIFYIRSKKVPKFKIIELSPDIPEEISNKLPDFVDYITLVLMSMEYENPLLQITAKEYYKAMSLIYQSKITIQY